MTIDCSDDHIEALERKLNSVAKKIDAMSVLLSNGFSDVKDAYTLKNIETIKENLLTIKQEAERSVFCE